jgi:hypothetical protein
MRVRPERKYKIKVKGYDVVIEERKQKSKKLETEEIYRTGESISTERDV